MSLGRFTTHEDAGQVSIDPLDPLVARGEVAPPAFSDRARDHLDLDELPFASITTAGCACIIEPLYGTIDRL
jgi:hypothetical protein